MIISSSQLGAKATEPPRGQGAESDETLCTRLRDLALVELDALTVGLAGNDAQVVIAAFADDVADALREARARIAALRQTRGGPEPVNGLVLLARHLASDAGQAGAERGRDRLAAQAAVVRSLPRLADLAACLVGKLCDADRRL